MKKRKKTVSKGYNGYIIGAAVLAVIIIIAVVLNKGTPAAKGGAVKFDLYVMSQCPYGVQAEDIILPVIKSFGDSVDFSLYFIAGDDGKGNFQSLHGNNEVLGDIVQLCAIEKEPVKYADFILCMNQNSRAIPGNWQDCAKNLGMNVNDIKTCYEGSEGKQLLSDSIKKSDSANAQGSPTIIINGQDYQGQRDAISFTRAICKYSTSSLCSNIPVCAADSDCLQKEGKVAICKNAGLQSSACEYQDDAKVELTVLNDKKCSSCDTSHIIPALQKIFLNMDIKEADISSDEGKKIVSEMSIKVVPSFIFNSNLENTYAYKSNANLRTIFEQKSGQYKISDSVTGASHYIDEKARQDFLKSIGVTLGDNKPQIDFYVMSYCPYGNQAEEMIKPIYDNLKDKAEFNPRYVIYSNYQSADYCFDSTMKYCSMHGKQELNQDVRELCVNKYLGIKSWFDFAIAMNSKCNYQNADSCWEAVAKDLGIDTQKIKDCEASESAALLEKEKQLNDLLGVQGSPTMFIEGEQYNGQRDANSVQSAMCSAFDTKPSECANSITGTASSTTATAGDCGT